MSKRSLDAIRLAGKDDIEGMVELLRALFAIETDFEFDAARQKRGLNLLLESANGKIWVAAEQERIVGMCTLQVLVSTAEGGAVGLVEDVVVAEDRRGQGIGRRLLTTAASWARENGLSRLQLLADRENHSALSFYERQGWRGTRLIALRLCCKAHWLNAPEL